MFRSVICKLKESSSIILFRMVRIAEQVKQICVGAFYRLNLFLVEFGSVYIELSSRALEPVGLTGLGVCAYISNASLCVSAFYGLNAKQEFHDAFKLFSLVCAQIFITDNMDGILALLCAMLQHGVEVAGVQTSIQLDPIVPPLGEVLVILELGLRRVAERIHKSGKRDKHVNRITNAANHLV